jgi:hypothetical protein
MMMMVMMVMVKDGLVLHTRAVAWGRWVRDDLALYTRAVRKCRSC